MSKREKSKTAVDTKSEKPVTLSVKPEDQNRKTEKPNATLLYG